MVKMAARRTKTVKSDGFRGKAWKRVKGTTTNFPNPKATIQHDEPIGPERKSRLEQLKESAAPILGHLQSAAASMNAHGQRNAWITPPPAGYFGGLPGERHEQPRRRKGKRRQRREPEDDGPDWQDMMAVPPSARRWMM